MRLLIEDVTIRKVETIDSETSVREATERMISRSTSCLIVLTGGEISGILTTCDVVSRVVAKGLDPESTRAADVMSKPVIMMRPDTPLEEAIKIMLQHKIKKIPLVTSHAYEDRLVGLLSLSDIIESHSEIFSQLWEEALMITTVIAEKGEFVVVATQ